MRRRETVELLLIGGASALALLSRPLLPAALPAGEIALTASALLLAQGLLRDLWIKFSLRKKAGAACVLDPDRKGTCICMESTLGVFGILAGVAALLGGVRRMITLPSFFWPLLGLAIGLLGFVLKSLVIDWKTRRIRIERHHEDVVF